MEDVFCLAVCFFFKVQNFLSLWYLMDYSKTVICYFIHIISISGGKFFWSTALHKISSIVNLLGAYLLLIKRKLHSHTSGDLIKNICISDLSPPSKKQLSTGNHQ